MINPQTLAVLLRTIRPDASELQATRPVQAVAATPGLRAEDAHEGTLRAALDGLARMAADPKAVVASIDSTLESAVPRSAQATPAEVESAPARSERSPLQRAPLPEKGHSARPQASAVALSSGGEVLQAAYRVPIAAGDRIGIHSAVPITPLPPFLDAAPLASALREAITTSGLFYESHVEAWAQGGYPRAALDREPQARWATVVPRTDAAGQPDAGGRAPVAAAGQESVSVASQAAATAPLPGDAAPLVRNQLDVLESNRFLWLGELWPGQRAEIAFEEERRSEERDPEDAETDPPVWGTRIVLELKDLGRVVARLRVEGDLVRCQIEAERPYAAVLLAGAQADFAQALAVHALSLEQCQVTHDAA